jgi:hypothetical protein
MKRIAIIMAILFTQSALYSQEPPLREISLIATADGFYPERIVAFKGEKIKFFFTATTDNPSCLILEGHKVFISAEVGKIAESEAVLNTSGDFEIYCPSIKYKAKLTVLDRPSDKRSREIAVEKVKSYWTPKEY